MIKLSNIQPTVLCNCSSLLRIPVRTITKEVNRIPIVRKWIDDKKFFGPLLKSKKKRKHKKNFKNEATTVNTKSQVNKNNVKNKDNNNIGLSELCWAGEMLKVKRIQVVKHTHSHQFSVKNDFILTSNASDTPLSNKIKINKINNYISSNNINNSILNSDNSSTLSMFKKLNNSINIPNSAIRMDNTINMSTKLEENSIYQNFPLINTAKCDEDQWIDTKSISAIIIDKKNIDLPGVTTILKETTSEKTKLMLEKWQQKMILKLGEIGFKNYIKAQLDNSKLMHSLIADYLSHKSIDIPDHLTGTFRSMKLILKNINDVRSLESHVIHLDLRYRGIIDCVANYGGNLCLIDWKKCDKIKTLSTTYDLPLQLSAYVGALNSDPNYPFKVKTAVLAIAYPEGQPPSVFKFSEEKLQFYWKEWLKRLEKYYLMKSTESL